MRPPEPREKLPLLGVAAYLLVPGERRRRAAGHFRRAGFEALRGVATLARSEKAPREPESNRRESIEVE